MVVNNKICISQEARDAIELSIDILFTKQKGIETLLPSMANKYPLCVSLQILTAIMLFLSFSVDTIQKEFPKYLGRINLDTLTESERFHYEALIHMQNIDFYKAFEVYRTFIKAYPQDKLSVLMLKKNGFLSGRIIELAEPFELVYEHHKDDPNFLGMLAFIYSHIDHHYLDGKKHIETALQLDPHNAWVQHVYAHLIEPEEHYGGIEFLNKCTADWPIQSRFFQGHNWMHLCVLYLQEAHTDVEFILDVCHKHIWGEAKELLFEQNNAFLTLWHLELAEQSGRIMLTATNRNEINKLWNDLAKYAREFMRNYFTPYLTVTAILVVAMVNMEEAQLALADFETFAQQQLKNSPKYYAWHEIGLPILNGCLAYIRGDYLLATTLLKPVHNITTPMGHSSEQRDIFRLTYDNAIAQCSRGTRISGNK